MARLPPSLRWLILLGLTAALTGGFAALHLSAALLLGAMGAAIALAAFQAGVTTPKPLFLAAQAVLGCMIGRAMVPSIVSEIVGRWPLFLGTVLSVLVAACLLGVLLTRWRVLPGTVALWGSFPGAATAMVLMAEAYGADIRLVAFMQYLRVVIVAVIASGVARVVVPVGATAAQAWFPAVAWPALLATLAIAAVGTLVGGRLRLPAAPLLGPMILAAVLQDVAGLRIELPAALLAVSYSIIGWGIGQRFTREILVYALKAAPRVAASILALVVACGGFAAILVVLGGVDPLTAYLATSPGGADTIAIIAASSKVDVPFVMALQMSRFLVILVLGPSLARFLAERLAPRSLERREAGDV